ncbi:general stress protein CsbA [Granulicella aggregans]|uniref:General stress protein CsbA n=1 Tax=Granulicella aggregans TaxID=474949 RepID=A0A7W8E660_9BACT|nr:hypothetical protein [Granulicella aggregans]MBB5060004.1 general stress protein CsbA [Granulicella aggregans]
MVVLFSCLIVLQFAIILTHDLVDIPGWVHGSQIQAMLGRRKVWLATLANSVFPGIAAGFAINFWNRPKPGYVPNYWLIYCSVATLSAIGMWYIPYLRGAPEKQKIEYLNMYAGTRHVLPKRGDNPRPNLFHMGIHVLFVVNLCLALALREHRT